MLSRVLRYTLEGWPPTVPVELQPYARRQNELTTEAGCLLWGIKVIVPEKYRQPVLEELHTSHPGIVRMKLLAHLHVWWPSVDSQIDRSDGGLLCCLSKCVEQATYCHSAPLGLAHSSLAAHPCGLCWSIHGQHVPGGGGCPFKMG